MKNRWFLDMCIILYYVGEGDRDEFIKKTKNFIDNKKNSLLLCYYIKDKNIPKWLNRQRILFRELIKQINDSDYKPYSSKEASYLVNRDKNKIIKLIALFRNTSDKKEIIVKFERAYNEIEYKINSFLKEKIDEFVTPISEIDFDLKSCLFTCLKSNESDAKTIASAVQEHNKRDLIILTADKKDWNKNLLEEIYNDITLKKKYLKLPVIKYVQDYD